jgi:hypothetical protein
MNRSARFVVAVALMLVAVVTKAGEVVAEPKLKAGFIANFVQFVKWPGNPARPVVCGFGAERDGDALHHLQEFIAQDSLPQVKRIRKVQDISGCQAVFLEAGQAGLLPTQIEASAARPVLIITDFEGGTPLGATISFVATGGGRLGFDLSHSAAQAAGLIINTRLMQLARRVY